MKKNAYQYVVLHHELDEFEEVQTSMIQHGIQLATSQEMACTAIARLIPDHVPTEEAEILIRNF